MGPDWLPVVPTWLAHESHLGRFFSFCPILSVFAMKEFLLLFCSGLVFWGPGSTFFFHHLFQAAPDSSFFWAHTHIPAKPVPLTPVSSKVSPGLPSYYHQVRGQKDFLVTSYLIALLSSPLPVWEIRSSVVIFFAISEAPSACQFCPGPNLLPAPWGSGGRKEGQDKYRVIKGALSSVQCPLHQVD